MSLRKRRGTAEPRWGWSGVAPVTPAKLSRADVESILAVLPYSRRRPIKPILVELSQLGGRFHRYLHQDEFGPSRAERMAALRALLDYFGVLIPLLKALPTPSRLWLCKQLAVTASTEILVDMDNDFGAFANDEEALQQLAAAASLYDSAADTALTGAAAMAIADLTSTAETTAVLFSNLDSTTAGTLIDEFRVHPLSVAWDEESYFAIVYARLCRLNNRIERALAQLESRGGPDPLFSLNWLVWELCDLYSRETGQPVTSSAITDYIYTGIPQSQAGRFVLACVEALQPSNTWVMQPDHQWVEKTRRPRILDKNARGRAVYFAMREYVARRPVGTRRGHPKRV
jgi:hypothetical protein